MRAILRRLITRWIGAPPETGAPVEVASIRPPEFLLPHPDNADDGPTSFITGDPVPYDENLLERARTQWQFGDWENLARMDHDTLRHHPDRAKLALLTAAGRLQTGQDAEAKQYIRLAQDWGVSKKLISQILISGVHNSIGRAAAIGNQQDRALQHFRNAVVIGTPGADGNLLTQARLKHQLGQLPVGNNGQPSFRLETPTAAAPSAPLLNNDIYAVLEELHESINPRFYLEIGVGGGRSLALAKCKAVGIDPVSQERMAFGPNVHIVQASSDEFFANQAQIWLRALPLDFVLIAGIPLVDYVLRSLVALELHALPSTLVAIPGIYPRTAESATRHRTADDWRGDVWKLPSILREIRPDLQLLELDVEPAGLLLITRLDPRNKALTERRQEFASRIQRAHTAPHQVLHRTEAASLGDSFYTTFLQAIQSLKT